MTVDTKNSLSALQHIELPQSKLELLLLNFLKVYILALFYIQYALIILSFIEKLCIVIYRLHFAMLPVLTVSQ